MDAFRQEQKKECLDGSQNKRSRYGCQCCRKHADLGSHKKYARRMARVRLKRQELD